MKSDTKKLIKDYQLLLRVAVDLAKSISDAEYKNVVRFKKPTPHMRIAVDNFEKLTGIILDHTWDNQS